MNNRHSLSWNGIGRGIGLRVSFPSDGGCSLPHFVSEGFHPYKSRWATGLHHGTVLLPKSSPAVSSETQTWCPPSRDPCRTSVKSPRSRAVGKTQDGFNPDEGHRVPSGASQNTGPNRRPMQGLISSPLRTPRLLLTRLSLRSIRRFCNVRRSDDRTSCRLFPYTSFGGDRSGPGARAPTDDVGGGFV